jgi:sugar/nucleoside kinase (ribokinase family)
MNPQYQWAVLGIGANSIDYVTVVPAFPRPEGWYSKMQIRRHLVTCGGQTATAMAVCARFGLRARYIGAVGGDENGRRVLAELPRHGVDASGVVAKEGRNQFAVIVIDGATGERAVLWDRDPSLALRDEDVPLETIAAARVLHVDDVDQAAAVRAARHATSLGIPVTSDLDRMTERTAELVDAVTYPIFADGLHEELTGCADHEEALRRLRRPHHRALCITLGQHGAVALAGGRLLRSPGFKVEAVDTTGSGDVFRGAFIYAVLQDWDVERTVRFANAAAALACTGLGAMAGIPDLQPSLSLAGLSM